MNIDELELMMERQRVKVRMNEAATLIQKVFRAYKIRKYFNAYAKLCNDSIRKL